MIKRLIMISVTNIRNKKVSIIESLVFNSLPHLIQTFNAFWYFKASPGICK